jgi:hypothetical protein
MKKTAPSSLVGAPPKPASAQPHGVAACLIYEVRQALWEIGNHADALGADLDSLTRHLGKLELALESVRTQAQAEGSGVWLPLLDADAYCMNLRIDLHGPSRHLDRLEEVLESATAQAEAAETAAAALEAGDGQTTAEPAETAAPATSAAGQFIVVDLRGPRVNTLRTAYGPFDSRVEAIRWAYFYLRPKPFAGPGANCNHQIAVYPPQPPTPGPK